jgi:N utilization substance protein A
LNQFVDRVERGVIRRRNMERRAEDDRLKSMRAAIPEKAFGIFLEDLPFSPRIYDSLAEAGYDTLGSLMLQLEVDADSVLALGGIGPKAMDEIKSVIASVKFPVEAELVAPLETEQPAVEGAPVAEAQASEVVEKAVQEAGVEAPVAGTEIAVETAPLETGMAEVPVMAETGTPVAGIGAVGVEVKPEGELVEKELIAAGEEAAQKPTEPGEGVPTAEGELEEEKVPSLDQLFKLTPEILSQPVSEEDEEEDLDKKGKKKKGKKQRKFTEVEYDPDRDVLVVKRKKKRGGWEDEWDV